MNAVSDFTQTAACAPVKAFQSAWNAAGGTPALTVDGGYGPQTGSANAAVAQANNLGNVQAGLTSGYPTCGGGTPPPPPPTTCPQGQTLVNGQCVPTPAPSPSTSSSSLWPWILGGAGLLAVGGVIYAATKKPSSKELASAGQKHAMRATTHRKIATHMHAAAHHRAREEAADKRRGGRRAA
jgi:hypothetical protein